MKRTDKCSDNYVFVFFLKKVFVCFKDVKASAEHRPGLRQQRLSCVNTRKSCKGNFPTWNGAQVECDFKFYAS